MVVSQSQKSFKSPRQSLETDLARIRQGFRRDSCLARIWHGISLFYKVTAWKLKLSTIFNSIRNNCIFWNIVELSHVRQMNFKQNMSGSGPARRLTLRCRWQRPLSRDPWFLVNINMLRTFHHTKYLITSSAFANYPKPTQQRERVGESHHCFDTSSVRGRERVLIALPLIHANSTR